MVQEQLLVSLGFLIHQSTGCPRTYLTKLNNEETFPNYSEVIEIIFFHVIIQVNETFDTQAR